MGSNGGVWEWSSTKLDNHDGLSPTNLFTGFVDRFCVAPGAILLTFYAHSYSTDFFDNKHQIVVSKIWNIVLLLVLTVGSVKLGASYATIPRLAGRKTVRNFYQHNYPYPWVGGRVVYDL